MLSQIINYFLPNDVENCCFSKLRNETFFSLFNLVLLVLVMVTMNLNYVRFIEAKLCYIILGFNKLKNQRNNCDVG